MGLADAFGVIIVASRLEELLEAAVVLLKGELQESWYAEGSMLRERTMHQVPLGTFLTFWVPIYNSGPLFSVFWQYSRKECQISLHVHNNE